jgi:predicted dehydrogenase
MTTAARPGGNLAAAQQRSSAAPDNLTRPRLGFLGVGWIGRHRMQAIHDDGAAEIMAIADALPQACDAALEVAPGATTVPSMEAMLELPLDGIVIATPSALHAQQSIAALERGVAVFCQKPLARTADECQAVVEAARRADRLLGVDLSYRHTDAMRAIRQLVVDGGIGHVYAVDLVFHNAYGPDKAWFRDPRLSGGGCVMDLGVHLVDLALWVLDFPALHGATARLYAGGRPLAHAPDQVEDYAEARVDLDGGVTVRLACSWNLSAGRDAVIEARFHGTQGGAAMRNLDGSFYDFVAEQYDGRTVHQLSQPGDAWGGRAAVQWSRQLAHDGRFDPSAQRLVDVSRALDLIYGR